MLRKTSILGGIVALGLSALTGLFHREAAIGTPQVLRDVDLVEVFRAGSDADADGPLFSNILRVSADSEGQVYVADWGSRSVYVLSSQGDVLHMIGREGEGPGEFSRIADVFIGDRDSVFVWDRDLNRATVFTPGDYRVAETVPVRAAGAAHPSRLIAVVPEGFLISYRTPYGLTPEWSAEAERFEEAFLVDRKGRAQKTPLVRLPEMEAIVNATSGSISVSSMPFGKQARLTLGPKQRLYAGWNDAISITVYSMDGTTLRVLAQEHEPVPVTFTERSAVIRRRGLRNVNLPKTKPAYRHFVVDDESRVWVHLSSGYGDSTAVCLILNPDGSEMSRITLPVDLQLEAVRDMRAYGVLTPEGGAPELIAYAITM